MSRRGHGEGSIYKRQDGRWAATVDVGWVDGKRQRKTVYGKTQEAVIAKRNTLLRQIEDGLVVSNDRLTVAKFLGTWLADTITPSDLADSTKASYADIVNRHLTPRIGQVRLNKLTPQQVQALLNDLRDAGYSPRTVQYAHAVLRRALGQAERWGLVTRNVARLVDVPRPRANPAKVHALTVDQARQLLAAAKGDRLYGLYVVVLMLGLRRGEALGLRWSDVELDAGTLRVEQQVIRVPGQGLVVSPLPKTASSRRINHVPGFAVEVLRQHRLRQLQERLSVGERWHEHDLVFPSTIGTPLEPRNLTRHLHQLCKTAGLPPERFHNLRHTAASIGFAEGLDPKMIQHMLSHSSIGVTMDTYTHLVPGLQKDAAERIGKALGA